QCLAPAPLAAHEPGASPRAPRCEPALLAIGPARRYDDACSSSHFRDQTMTERLALVIAVEAYQDRAIPPANHAEADSAAFAAALERLGFAPEQQTILLGPAATRTAVSSRLRKL